MKVVRLQQSAQHTWPQISFCLSNIFSKISSCPQLSPVRSSNNQGVREKTSLQQGREHEKLRPLPQIVTHSIMPYHKITSDLLHKCHLQVLGTLRSLKITVWELLGSRVSQPWHSWRFGLANSVVDALWIIGYLASMCWSYRPLPTGCQ
jgi:hypothetical protein